MKPSSDGSTHWPVRTSYMLWCSGQVMMQLRASFWPPSGVAWCGQKLPKAKYSPSTFAIAIG